MKNIITTVVLTVLGIGMLAIILTIAGRYTRRVETEEALKLAVEQSLANAMDTRSYTIDSNEELIADFQQNLLYQLENDGDVQVEIEGVDYEKGLLSVTVTEEFAQFLAGRGRVTYATTLVMEKVGVDSYVTITYLDENSQVIKRSHLPAGERLLTPEGTWEKVQTEESGEVVRDRNGKAIPERDPQGRSVAPENTAKGNVAYQRISQEDASAGEVPAYRSESGNHAGLPLALVGWSREAGQKIPEYVDGENFIYDGNARLYGVYDLFGVTLRYRGNGATGYRGTGIAEDEKGYYFTQTDIKNLDGKDTYHPSDTAENPFLREEYDQKTKSEARYTFVGWSFSPERSYRDPDQILRAGSHTFLDGAEVDWVREVMTSLQEHTFDTGSGTQEIYAIWDAFPEAEIETIVVNSHQIDDLRKEELLDAVINAWDKEDGDRVKVTIKDEEIDRLKEELHILSKNSTAASSLLYEVEDGFGNITPVVTDVWVNRETPEEEHKEGYQTGHAKDGYFRYISPVSYEKGEEDGGLREHSLWKVRKDYAAELQEAFENIGIYGKKGVISYEKRSKETWYFSHEDVLEAQQFLEEYGIGKYGSTSDDQNLLTLWQKRFAKCR